MSKTILQEIATFNAQEFDSAKVKTEIKTYQESVDEYYATSKEIIADNLSDYKLIADNIKNSLNDNNNLTDINLNKNRLLINTLESFTITEIAKNYRSLGVIRQEHRRNHDLQNTKIEMQRLQKLDYYTGPIALPINDSQGNWTGTFYPADADDKRTWLYTRVRALRFAQWDLLKLSADFTTLTIGNPEKTSNVVLPGTLTMETNLTINNGFIKVTSPAGVTSITTNNDIHSTAGAVKATTGLSTVDGDIKTGVGNIKTLNGNIDTGAGNIHTASGDITTDAGKVGTFNGPLFATTGVTTTNGNITTGTGNLEIANGNIYTAAGFIRTDTGAISTGAGDISTADGSISTLSGNITTNQGSITTADGNLYTARGDISTLRGDIYTTDGRLWVGTGPALTSYDMMMDNGDLWISGDFHAPNGSMSVARLDTTGDITARNLTLSGNVTANGAGTNKFTGSVITGALYPASITTTGIVNTGNLVVGGTLTVTSTSQFTGNINASGYTVTADKFIGLATSANYADVAEKYLSDKVYAPGTVVCLGGDNEITLYDSELPLAGVISTAPGVILNDSVATEDQLWLTVALVGRIPVKTVSDIKKGMYIFPDANNPGNVVGLIKIDAMIAMATSGTIGVMDMIGIALSDSANGYVEVKV